MNELVQSGTGTLQGNELRVWGFRPSNFSFKKSESEDFLQVLTTMSCGQNIFSNVDMHMKLTVHLHYATEFLSDTPAMNSLKASKSLGNEYDS